MKIKSLLSLLACGVASQFMAGCSSSGQYFDFSTPATTYHKAAPAPAAASNTLTIAQAEPVNAPTPVPATEAPALEANAAKPAASRQVARTAPLTSAAVASALEANPHVNALATKLADAKSKRDVKMATKSIKREVKSAKKANALNQYMKIGLVLLLAGLILSVLPGLGYVGGIVAIVGLVFLLLGVLEM
jgi:hypothetical protein